MEGNNYFVARNHDQRKFSGPFSTRPNKLAKRRVVLEAVTADECAHQHPTRLDCVIHSAGQTPVAAQFRIMNQEARLLALSTFRVWRYSQRTRLYSRGLRIRSRSVPGEALALPPVTAANP